MSADNTPAVEPLVRVYNKRAHHIQTGPHKAAPSAFATVPKSVADAWMKQWPVGIVEAAVAQREINGAAAEAAQLREQAAAKDKRIAELEAQLARPAPASGKRGGRQSGADLV